MTSHHGFHQVTKASMAQATWSPLPSIKAGGYWSAILSIKVGQETTEVTLFFADHTPPGEGVEPPRVEVV